MIEQSSLEIKAIFGEEPKREGEYPNAYEIGYDSRLGVRVTHITEQVENLGQYGIHWFYVWSENQLVAKMNASFVSTVTYKGAKS